MEENGSVFNKKEHDWFGLCVVMCLFSLHLLYIPVKLFFSEHPAMILTNANSLYRLYLHLAESSWICSVSRVCLGKLILFWFLAGTDYIIFRVKVTLYSLFCHSRYVCIAMEALDQLLMACHCQSINLFVESFLKMVRKLLESDKPSLQILGTNSVSFQNFTIALYQFDDSHCL